MAKTLATPAGKPQGAPKPPGPVAQALTAAQAVRRPGKGGGALPVTPLARAIRNAYKGAKAGRQVADILRRIEDAEPAPSAQEIARALAASGIPAHRAGRVAMDWDSMESLSRPPAPRAKSLLAQVLEDADPKTGVSARLRAQLAEQQEGDGRRHAAAAARSLPAGQWEWEDLGRAAATESDKGIACMIGTLYRTGEERQRLAIILRILRGLAPSPERLEAALSEIPERDRMVLTQHYRDGLRVPPAGELGEAREIFDRLHQAKAEGRNLLEAIAGPDPIKLAADMPLEAPELAAQALPATAEDCPAYVKRAFDAAEPHCIAYDTGNALFAVWPIWAPGRPFRLEGDRLLDAAGIPCEWAGPIIRAAADAENDEEKRAREAEIARRRAAPPKPEAEAAASLERLGDEFASLLKDADQAQEPIGAALKALTESGYAVTFNGKAANLVGPALGEAVGVHVRPGDVSDIRAQLDVVIGLVDGVTNLLPERDPQEREARKLSALREQVENLISLLEPVLSGEEGGPR